MGTAEFKSLVTKRINDSPQNRRGSVWQRNYYEHVIRDEESLNRIREYISTNAQRWEFDRENFQAAGKMVLMTGSPRLRAGPKISRFFIVPKLLLNVVGCPKLCLGAS